MRPWKIRHIVLRNSKREPDLQSCKVIPIAICGVRESVRLEKRLRRHLRRSYRGQATESCEQLQVLQR